MRLTLTFLAASSALVAVLLPAKEPTLIGVVTVTEEIKMPIIQPEMWAILTIIGEAASEPLEGQIAVANVIRNRMRRQYSSDGTVIGTVLRPKQFSMWDDKARIYAAQCELESPAFYTAAEAWYRSNSEKPVGDAVLYHTDQVDPRWRHADSVTPVRQIGAHIFYEDRGRGI